MNNQFLAIMDDKVGRRNGKGFAAAIDPPRSSPRLDPRPDLAKDSTDWEYILSFADNFNGNVYGRLHFLRCGGARIERTQSGYRLQQGTEEWVTPKAWAEQKRIVLDPVREAIVFLFREAAAGAAAETSPADVADLYQDCPFLQQEVVVPGPEKKEERQADFGWQTAKPNQHPR